MKRSWDVLFKNNKLLNWILLIFATIQFTSQLFNYMLQNRIIENSPYVNVLVSLGTPISDNWYSYSSLFIFTVLVCILYNKIINKECQKHNNFSVIFMLLVNLVLCNKLYSSVSVREKANYIMNNKHQFIFIPIIILIFMIIIYMLNKSHKLNEEFSNTSPPDANNNEEQAKNDIANPQFNSDSEYVWKHPFAYVWNTYKYYFAQRKQVKNLYRKQKAEIKVGHKIHKKSLKNKENENELKLLEEKLKTDVQVNNILQEKRVKNASLSDTSLNELYNKNSSIPGIIAIIVTFIIIAVIIFIIIITGKNEFAEKIKDVIQDLNILGKFINEGQDSSLNFILACGSLLLLLFIPFLLFFVIYLFVRIIIYFLSNTKEDNLAVERLVHLNKRFIFELGDSVMRILLFLPDFLECVQNILLETSLDEKLDEVYGLKNDFKSYSNQNENGKENDSEQVKKKKESEVDINEK